MRMRGRFRLVTVIFLRAAFTSLATRPAKLFTAHEGLFVADIGLLKADSLRAIKAAVITVIQKDS